MATELTVIECARNDETTGVVGVDASSSTGVYVDCNDIDASKIVFRCVASDSAAATFKAGMYSAEGVGDLKISSTAADTVFVGPLETARFKDTDGYINVLGSSAADSVGNYSVQAILLP